MFNFEDFLSFMPANMTKIVIFSLKKGCFIKTPLSYIVAYEKMLLEKKLRKRDSLENLVINEKVILKWFYIK